MAPDIQKAILEGRQPPSLTLDRIIKSLLPLDWRSSAATSNSSKWSLIAATLSPVILARKSNPRPRLSAGIVVV